MGDLHNLYRYTGNDVYYALIRQKGKPYEQPVIVQVASVSGGRGQECGVIPPHSELDHHSAVFRAGK